MEPAPCGNISSPLLAYRDRYYYTASPLSLSSLWRLGEVSTSRGGERVEAITTTVKAASFFLFLHDMGFFMLFLTKKNSGIEQECKTVNYDIF